MFSTPHARDLAENVTRDVFRDLSGELVFELSESVNYTHTPHKFRILVERSKYMRVRVVVKAKRAIRVPFIIKALAQYICYSYAGLHAGTTSPQTSTQDLSRG